MKIHQQRYTILFLLLSYHLMAQPQHTTEQQVVALIDNVIGWQSQPIWINHHHGGMGQKV